MPSVLAGIQVLNDGGNAVDSATATLFALNITDHGYCSIGGEAPMLVYDNNTKGVVALSGQGRAPLAEHAIRWYLMNGIPGPGDIKMAPVPAVVDLAITALQTFGTMTLERVLKPALKLLHGSQYPWSSRLASTFEKLIEAERRTVGSRDEKLQAAGDRFYGRGSDKDIAEDLALDYKESGGFLTLEDLAKHRTTVEQPVHTVYRGFDVFKCGPWTQGPVLLQALRLLEGYEMSQLGHLSDAYIHVVVEAMKLAMADRDRYYGDPEFVSVPLQGLLSDRYTEMRRTLIDPDVASSDARPGDVVGMKPLLERDVFHPGQPGTTTCLVADRFGNVVSATPSANVDQDSDGGRTGVTYGNRLMSFNTTPGHPNCIEPGKRPRITLTPTLVLKRGRPRMAVSVAGGDMQDQVTLQLLLASIDFAMRPEEAVRSPRFVTTLHQSSFDPTPDRLEAYQQNIELQVSTGIEAGTIDSLAVRGHVVRQVASAIAAPSMIELGGPGEAWAAAGDPMAGRNAAGI